MALSIFRSHVRHVSHLLSHTSPVSCLFLSPPHRHRTNRSSFSYFSLLSSLFVVLYLLPFSSNTVGGGGRSTLRAEWKSGGLDIHDDMKLVPRFSPWTMAASALIGTSLLWILSYSTINSGGVGQFRLAAATISPSKGPGSPPVLAYWISGTRGEKNRLLRLLKAVYHPRNRYLLHLDADSTDAEKTQLALSVQSDRIFQTFGNVDVVNKTYAVDRTGPSLLAATLRGAAILLRTSLDWDWFIALSSSDYPIVTQDDLLHAFTPLPRDLNFIDYTSDLGWKKYNRFQRMVIDPSLYNDRNSNLFFSRDTRDIPDAFTLFTGSPWMILTRSLMEHCVAGSWDNLPRKLLMYFTNTPYTMESYFQTVILNSPRFKNTTIKNDMRYIKWDDPPRLESLVLNLTHYKKMAGSGAPFARRFMEGDPILRKIDKSILSRGGDGVVFGSWCSGDANKEEDRCFSWGDIDVVKPSASGKKLRKLVSKLVRFWMKGQ